MGFSNGTRIFPGTCGEFTWHRVLIVPGLSGKLDVHVWNALLRESYIGGNVGVSDVRRLFTDSTETQSGDWELENSITIRYLTISRRVVKEEVVTLSSNRWVKTQVRSKRLTTPGDCGCTHTQTVTKTSRSRDPLLPILHRSIYSCPTVILPLPAGSLDLLVTRKRVFTTVTGTRRGDVSLYTITSEVQAVNTGCPKSPVGLQVEQLPSVINVWSQTDILVGNRLENKIFLQLQPLCQSSPFFWPYLLFTLTSLATSVCVCVCVWVPVLL